MTYSNLSKIRPKLRTTGNITGNFGRPKSKGGSSLNDLGVTDAKTVSTTGKVGWVIFLGTTHLIGVTIQS